jgi:TrmH family RNA methyltransferase
MKIINSVDNKLIKNISLLKKSKERRRQKLFFVDGLRQTKIAINNGYKPKYFFFCSNLIKNNKDKDDLIKKINKETEIIEVSEKVFKKISYKENPDGVLSVFKYNNKNINDIKESNFLVVLDNIEKPGNLGAIIRTISAANVKNIIITGKEFDIFNPNVIKASEGLIFSVNIVNVEKNKLLEYLNKHKYNKVGTLTNGNKNYTKIDYSRKTAIIMGSEAEGLGSDLEKILDEKIKIPMRSEVDSLNLSVSTAIIVYEALRQNNFNDLL